MFIWKRVLLINAVTTAKIVNVMAYSKDEIDKIFNEIIFDIENGCSLRASLLKDNRPDSTTFYKWIDNEDEKSIQYKKCKINLKGSRAKSLDDYRVKNANQLNKKKFPNSNIYLIKIENSCFYKIGVSQNTNRRIRDISSSMPFNIIVVIDKKVKDAYSLENELHIMFKKKYIKSEWFELTETDINVIKSLC